MARSCGSCSKCCEGYIVGIALDKPFFPGNPCHFLSIGSGCTVYKDRPKHPCRTYSCSWLINPEVPEWMKPDQINAIIDERFINDIPYIQVTEAGENLRSSVLTWVIKFALENKKNIAWQVNGGKHMLGTPEFLKAMSEPIVVQG